MGTAKRVLPPGRAADWNQALMDYDALVKRATPRRPGGGSEPFVCRNRFWRGRIVDALGDHGRVSMDALLDALPDQGRDDDRVRGLVRVLHEECMVTYDADEDAVDLPASLVRCTGSQS